MMPLLIIALSLMVIACTLAVATWAFLFRRDKQRDLEFERRHQEFEEKKRRVEAEIENGLRRAMR